VLEGWVPVAADAVIILDSDWNPQNDLQVRNLSSRGSDSIDGLRWFTSGAGILCSATATNTQQQDSLATDPDAMRTCQTCRVMSSCALHEADWLYSVVCLRFACACASICAHTRYPYMSAPHATWAACLTHSAHCCCVSGGVTGLVLRTCTRPPRRFLQLSAASRCWKKVLTRFTAGQVRSHISWGSGVWQEGRRTCCHRST
jgi:hypothetical protein